VTFIVRSERTATEGFLNQIRQAVWSVNSSLPASPRPMREVYDQSLARTSFTLVMLAIAASMALLLGVVGIYGVISYAVLQRRREIGIRAALGAQHGELKRMFVRHALALTGVGVADRTGGGRGPDTPDVDALVRHHATRSDDVCGGAGHPGDRHGARELPAGATGSVGRSGRSATAGVADAEPE
jgi:hypothetical protein